MNDHADLACATVGKHHSEDRVAIYHGSATPTIGCGFHATYFTAETINAGRHA